MGCIIEASNRILKILLPTFDKILVTISNFFRLIINLTSPVLMIYNEQMPAEKTERSIYQKLILHTQQYKVALTDDRIWTALSNRLSEILKLVSPSL